MNFQIVFYILGNVLSVLGAFLMLPSIVGFCSGEKEGYVYLAVGLISIAVGLLIRHKLPQKNVFYSRDGFVAVSLSWILISLVGAVPFYITGEIPSFVDALFETISGFTTTGSTILSDVEYLSKTSAFWRLFTHWVGGMGVLVFIMAVLPLSSSNSMSLMRAESPGPSVGKLVPKAKSTAMILYGIYMVITVSEAIALLCTGLNFYEAVTLTFSTVGTGGFGLLNSSVASYGISTQIVITVFMIVCGVNFNAYYLILKRRYGEAVRNEEIWTYFAIIFISSALIAWNIKAPDQSYMASFQTSIFQVASIISTTGFATDDFNLWPGFSRSLMAMLTFLGACAGSTGGGFKVSRVIILWKAVKNEVTSIAHPRSVNQVRIDKKAVPSAVVRTVLVYLALYITVLSASFLLLSIDQFDIVTNFTAVVATLNNVGPGLNVVGATGNFGGFSVFSKFVLMFDMLAGRLELFPVMILLSPDLWARYKVKK